MGSTLIPISVTARFCWVDVQMWSVDAEKFYLSQWTERWALVSDNVSLLTNVTEIAVRSFVRCDDFD